MFKRLLLILCITVSSLSFAGDYVGARIISLKAENIKITNFEIDEDWESPVVIVTYEIKERRNSNGDHDDTHQMRRKTIRFKIDSELLSYSEQKLVSKERGFFSSNRKQKNLARDMFTLKTTKSLSGRVLLLELQ